MNDVATRRPATASGEQPAAVLVVFGITGDLAEGDDVPVAVPAGAGRSCPRRPILGMKMPRSTAATSCHRSHAQADRSHGQPMLRQRPHRSLSDAPAIEETTSRPAGASGCCSAVKAITSPPAGRPLLVQSDRARLRRSAGPGYPR